MTTETLPAVRPAPVETVTPIKASEAIRLGCLIAPVQAFRTYGAGDRACVLGAMTIGLGLHELGYAVGDVGAASEWADAIDELPCPACRHDEALPPLAGQMLGAHLNDDHRWSRERIADWLEGLGL